MIGLVLLEACVMLADLLAVSEPSGTLHIGLLDTGGRSDPVSGGEEPTAVDIIFDLLAVDEFIELV